MPLGSRDHVSRVGKRGAHSREVPSPESKSAREEGKSCVTPTAPAPHRPTLHLVTATLTLSLDVICSGGPARATSGFQPRVPQEFGDQDQIGAAAHERSGEQDQELPPAAPPRAPRCRRRGWRPVAWGGASGRRQAHGAAWLRSSRKRIRHPAGARGASSRKSSCRAPFREEAFSEVPSTGAFARRTATASLYTYLGCTPIGAREEFRRGWPHLRTMRCCGPRTGGG